MLVSVRGVRLNVGDEGSGRPLVFLHGIGGDGSNWHPQVAAFSSSYRTVTVDMRGFGRSDRTYGLMTIDDYAADVADLLQKMDLTSCVLIGLSMGGMVAQSVALQCPDRLAGLVLADTSASVDDAMRQSLAMASQVVLERGMVGVADLFLDATFAPATIRERRPCVTEFRRVFTATDPFSFRVGLAAIAGLDLLDRIPAIRNPVMVLVGEYDALTPLSHAEAILRAIPGATLQTISNAGHLSNMERPDEFNSVIARFISTL